MSTWTVLGFLAIVVVGLYSPELCKFARRTCSRRARGEQKSLSCSPRVREGVTGSPHSSPLPRHFLDWDLIAQGFRAGAPMGWDDQTVARIKEQQH